MVRVRRCDRGGGFTLIELLAAMLLFGIVIAIGVAPYRRYERAQAHIATTRKVVAMLRNAQIRAVAEDATYRVTIPGDGRSYVLERRVAGSWQVQLRQRTSSKIFLRGAAFQQPDGTAAAAAYFYPRGSATKGSLVVAREDSGKTYTVNVEGLTARVSYA